MKRKTQMIVAALVAILTTITLAITVTFDEEGRPSVTVNIGTQASPKHPEVTIDADTAFEPDEQRVASDPTPADDGPEIHEDLKDESPPGAPENAATRVVEQPTKGVGPSLPVGGAQNYACTWHPVKNHSGRAPGSRVTLFVLHYTVSRPGTLAVIRGLFDRPSFGASSTFGLEPSGRCEQWVAFDRKPWTNGAFNSVTETVEIIALGTEPRSWWLQQPIIKRGILAAIVADRLRARGIPPRRVDPQGCGVQLAGWTDHHALECGNTHHDVSPGFPYDVFAAQVRRAYGATSYPQTPPPPKRKPSQRPACTTRNVQLALNRRGARLDVDGIYGTNTRRAVLRFQRSTRLAADGRVGPRTGTALGLRGCRG